MTASPSFPEREVFILKRVEEHIHPSHPLLLLQKESLMGKEFVQTFKTYRRKIFISACFGNQYNKLANQS